MASQRTQIAIEVLPAPSAMHWFPEHSCLTYIGTKGERGRRCLAVTRLDSAARPV